MTKNRFFVAALAAFLAIFAARAVVPEKEIAKIGPLWKSMRTFVPQALSETDYALPCIANDYGIRKTTGCMYGCVATVWTLVSCGGAGEPSGTADNLVAFDSDGTGVVDAADGVDCSSGEYARGIDAFGNAAGCTAAVGSGTVTSVALSLPSQFAVSGSPVTTSGTLAGAWNAQVANRVLCGPGSGADAAPTFRVIVDDDVPDGITVSLATNATTWDGLAKGTMTDTKLCAYTAAGAVINCTTTASVGTPKYLSQFDADGTGLEDSYLDSTTANRTTSNKQFYVSATDQHRGLDLSCTVTNTEKNANCSVLTMDSIQSMAIGTDGNTGAVSEIGATYNWHSTTTPFTHTAPIMLQALYLSVTPQDASSKVHNETLIQSQLIQPYLHEASAGTINVTNYIGSDIDMQADGARTNITNTSGIRASDINARGISTNSYAGLFLGKIGLDDDGDGTGISCITSDETADRLWADLDCDGTKDAAESYIDFSASDVPAAETDAAHDNFAEIGGSVTDGQVPNNITIDLAADATTWNGVVKGTMTDTKYCTYTAAGTTINCTSTPGGPSNSFGIMDAPAGTDPEADSATDTLAFTAAGSLTITGDSATDTLAFAVTETDAAHDNCSEITGCVVNAITAGQVPANETDAAHDSCAEISGCVTSALTGAGTNGYLSAWTGTTSLGNTASTWDGYNLAMVGGDNATLPGYVAISTLDDDLVTLRQRLKISGGEPSGARATGTVAYTNLLCGTECSIAATTAAALAANGANCAANQFALGVSAAGVAECAAIADADVPNTITVNVATKADELSFDPGDCAVNQFANAIGTFADLTCSAIVDADVPNTITIDNATAAGTATLWNGLAKGTMTDTKLCSYTSAGAVINCTTTGAVGDMTKAVYDTNADSTADTATALAANGSNCSAGSGAGGTTAAGAAEDCTAYVQPTRSLTGGVGIATIGDLSTDRTITVDSTEADFLTSGALTCGAATQGKAKVHTTPLQYCDNAATPALQYAAYSDSSGNATGVACSGSCVADAEVDNNITVDLATSASDLTCTNCIGPTEISDLALGTDTSGNYMTDLAAGVGIAVTHTPAEGSTGTVALVFSDAGDDPVLGAGGAAFSNEGASAAGLVFEGDTNDAFETRVRITDPTADRIVTIPNADSVTVQPDTGASNNFLTAISALGVISKAQPAFSNISGTATVAQGGTGAAPGADDQVLVSDSTSAATWRTLTNCTGTGKAATYATASNAWGCNTLTNALLDGSIHTDTAAGTVTAGDIIVGNDTPAWARLAGSGTDGYVAQYNSGGNPNVQWNRAPRKITFFSSIVPNVIGSGNDCSIGATNMNSMTLVGMPVMVVMTGYLNATLLSRAADAAGQTGAITCELRDITNSAVLLTSTTISSSTVCTSNTTTGTFSGITGTILLGCRCKNGTNGDDPNFSYCGVELW